PPEIGPHHTDHLVRFLIELDCAPEHLRIAAENAFPGAIRKHHFVVGFRLILFRRKNAAQQGLRFENVKPLGGNLRAAQPFGSRPAGVVEVDRILHRRGREDSVILPQQTEIRRRYHDALKVQLFVAHADGDHALGMSNARWMQQKTIHHAEDRGVRADTQRQRQNSDGGESWRLPQHAHSVAHVLPEAVHDSSPVAIESDDGPASPPKEVVSPQNIGRSSANRRACKLLEDSHLAWYRTRSGTSYCPIAGVTVANSNTETEGCQRIYFDFSSSSMRAGTISKRSPTTP